MTRVMQSFRRPRATTNPYITMLDEALDSEPSIEHVRFDWKTALFGRYDVFHWHWPEGKLHGTTWWKSVGKYSLTALIATRHALSRRIAVVRTVHNVELPDDNRPRLALLRFIDRHTTFYITLNGSTPKRHGVPHVLIPHGHYRPWYDRFQREHKVPGRLATFGGVRRYKNVSGLIDAFRDASRTNDQLSLEVGGRPSSPELRHDLEQRSHDLPGVTLTLRFIEDDELVRIVSRAELVVLAYRFMHNSGSVLAALSIGTAVLVPRNAVNDALAAEVGDAWVQRYDGELTGDAIVSAQRAVAEIAEGEAPNLAQREWDVAGAKHSAAYSAAVATKRNRGANVSS